MKVLVPSKSNAASTYSTSLVNLLTISIFANAPLKDEPSKFMMVSSETLPIPEMKRPSIFSDPTVTVPIPVSPKGIALY